MRIAEEVVRNGMAAGNGFMNWIATIIREYKCKKIVETGSYLGEGTTAAIRRGMQVDEEVYSIEVNPEYHSIAIENNLNSGIHFLNGLSVPRPQVPVDTTFNVPDHVIVDHYPKNRAALYRKEIAFNVPDCLLQKVLEKWDYKPDFVILDSAGHLGLIEFKYLMSMVKGSFYLALDDTNHVKHYESMQYILSHPEKFKVIFTTDEKFGSAIIKVSED